MLFRWGDVMDTVLDKAPIIYFQAVSQHAALKEMKGGSAADDPGVYYRVICDHVLRAQRFHDARATYQDMAVSIPGAVGGTAKRVDAFLVDKATPITAPVRAIERLRSFKSYGENWDAEGAPAPNPEAIDAAVNLVGFLAPFRGRLRVALDALGQPLILLSAGAAEAELTVVDERRIEFSVLGDTDDADVDVIFDGTTLPERLRGPLVSAGLAIA